MPTWLLFGLLGTTLVPSQEALPSQEVDPEYVEVRLVQIEVRVTDHDGKPIVGLTPGDFQVKEDGVIQEVRGARYVSALKQLSPGSAESGPATVAADEQAEVSIPEPTWIYIACEFGNASEFVRAFPSLRSFVEEQLQPGFRISLAGMPFTGSREVLEAILERMSKSPYGEGAMKPVVESSVTQMSDMELERRIAEEIQSEQGQLTLMSGFGYEPLIPGRIDQMNYFSVERIDRQLPLFGRMALFRYKEMIEKVSLLPGKKIVVLFRPGLPVDKDTATLMDEVTSLAVNHRVSFYTMDPKGLDTGIDVDSPRSALPWTGASTRRHQRGGVLADQMRTVEYQSGLASLAGGTGGKAIENINDMGAILDEVVEDAQDYYVLDYYPKERGNRGKFKKINVAVSVSGARVETVKGYYEPQEAGHESKQEREVALYRALLGGSSQQFVLTGRLDFFADPEHDAVLVSSVGVHPLNFAGNPEKLKDVKLEMAALTRISPTGLTQMPTYDESRAMYQLTRRDLESARRDETARVSVNGSQKLAPGPYRWQIVLQNLESGDLGTLEEALDVPDFRKPSTPGSLLLTRRVERIDPARESDPEAGLLEAGNLTYIPEPGSEFRQGDVVFVLYDLYNPTEADCTAAAGGMQMGLLRDDSPVPGVRAGGQAIVSQDKKVIHFAAYIETASLDPGDYQVFALLPNFQDRETAHVEDTFTLLPRLASE